MTVTWKLLRNVLLSPRRFRQASLIPQASERLHKTPPSGAPGCTAGRFCVWAKHVNQHFNIGQSTI
ncbi:MAG TPA: hypothetical protein VIF61_05025, partial [Methylocystis sp.]